MGDNDEEDDDYENYDEFENDYEDDDEENYEEAFLPAQHHHLLFDDDEMETDDSEMEMGREYDISKDAVDPEEVEAWKKQRHETNQIAQEKSTQNNCTFEKTPLNKNGKSKNDDKKKRSLERGKQRRMARLHLQKMNLMRSYPKKSPQVEKKANYQ